MAVVPQSAVWNSDGTITITWSGNLGLPTNFPIVSGEYSLQFELPSNLAVAPLIASGFSSAQLIGQSFVANNQTRFTPFVVTPTPGSTIRIQVRNSPSGSLGSITNGTYLISLSDQYSGAQTDLILNGSQQPTATITSGNQIVASSNYGRIINITAGSFNVRVNGATRSVSSVTSSGNQLYINFSGTAVNPSDVVTLSIDANAFDCGPFSPHANWSNINTPFFTVTNNTSWPTPNYSSSFYDNGGQRIGVSFDQNIVSNTPQSLSITGDFGGTRTATYAFTSGSTAYYNISGTPVYNTEFIQSISYAANQVRVSGAPFGQGTNNFFSIPAGTVSSGGASPPVPSLVSANISQDGTVLTINWNRSCSYTSGQITLSPTYSPVGSQQFGSPDQGNGSTQFIYYLDADPIRIGDSVNLNIPGSYALDDVSSQPNALSNGLITNNSIEPYDKPLYLDSAVAADGQTFTVQFDMEVTLKQSFTDNVEVIAQDKSDLTERVFTVASGTASLTTTTITNDTVTCTLTGGGVIFDPTGAAPQSGDDVAFHTNGFSGIVSSKLSEDAGQIALTDPIGTAPYDFANSETVDNNSTQPEPVTAVTPAYLEAEVYNQGINQFLRIRFNDGASTLQLQQGAALPVLSGSISGTTSLSFSGLQFGAGDNDEIVYQITGEKMKQAIDGEVVTLTAPDGIVVSKATGTPNAAFGPFTAGTNNFTNNSTTPNPIEPDTAPAIEDMLVSLDGLSLGLYFDVVVDAVSGQATIDSTLTGERLADLAVPAAEDTLIRVDLQGTLPIFRGESIFVSLPLGMVRNQSSGQTNLVITRQQVNNNNSLIPVPRAPVLDTCTLNTPGNLLTATFDIPVVEGSSTGYIISSRSGRHDVTIASVNSNIVNLNVDGLVFKNETVKLYLSKGFVKEGEYSFTDNDAITAFTVDVSGRGAGAPDLPSLGEDLTSEALE
jgi:hypothetical protein